VPVLAEFASRRGITFPLLSDTGSAVIRQYGLLNTTVATTNTTYGIPFPGTFIVDGKGVVTSRYFERAYQERDTITSVLVSRGRSIDVLPSGVLTGTLQAVTEEFSAEVDHLSRRYETVVVSASTPEQGTITVAAGAVGEVVICLRRGRSTHASLRALLAAVETSGASVRGIVFWDRGEPASPGAAWGKSRLELVG